MEQQNLIWLVATNNQTWGRGKTLEEACKNANLQVGSRTKAQVVLVEGENEEGVFVDPYGFMKAGEGNKHLATFDLDAAKFKVKTDVASYDPKDEDDCLELEKLYYRIRTWHKENGFTLR